MAGLDAQYGVWSMEQAVSFFVRPRAGWGLPRLAADVYVRTVCGRMCLPTNKYTLTNIHTLLTV